MIVRKKLWFAVLLGMFFPGLVQADGMLIPRPNYYANEVGQRAVIWHDGKRETLTLSTSFSGNASDMAWIIPVPAKPEVTHGKDGLFTALEYLTRPTYSDTYPAPLMGINGAVSSSRETKSQVTVVETKKVDIYDVSVLQASDGTELRKWLESNGYEYPATKDHLLQYYVTKNWYFVAAKITSIAAEYSSSSLQQGHATPLVIAFDSAQIVYPLKISGLGATSAEGLKIAAYGFETGTQNWMAGVNTTPAQTTKIGLSSNPVGQGKSALAMTRVQDGETDEDYAYVHINGLQSGKRYVFSGTAMVSKGTAAKVKLRVKSGSELIEETSGEAFGPTKQSVKLKLEFLADRSSMRFELVAMGMAKDDSVNWDAIQVEQGETVSDFGYELMPSTSQSTRLNSDVPIVLYVFSDHKKYVPGFEVEYAGNIKKKVIETLEFNDNGEPWMKTDKTMYLTKLTTRMAPAKMTDDLILRDAEDNSAVGNGNNGVDNGWKVALMLGIPLVLEVGLVGYFWYSKSRKAKELWNQ